MAAISWNFSGRAWAGIVRQPESFAARPRRWRGAVRPAGWVIYKDHGGPGPSPTFARRVDPAPQEPSCADRPGEAQ
jgi:hypothetical protein